MGKIFRVYLEGSCYTCKHCQTHLALNGHILSKSFSGMRGPAYLFDKVVNVTVEENQERMMTTGQYTVAEVFCVGCGSNVGWKIVVAHNQNRKFEEGKFVLESFEMSGPANDAGNAAA